MKYIRYALALSVILLMILLADIFGSKDIIFPEIAALVIGAWVVDKQPWEVNKRRIFFLMSISAVLGLLITRYVHIPVILQICLGFSIIRIMLHFAKTNFIPVISACLLPILMHTVSWTYPVSVFVLSFFIIAGQWLMEKYGIKEKTKFVPCNFSKKQELIKWAKLLLVIVPVSLLTLHYNILFVIAPPLIVIFTEFSNPNSKIRQFPLKVIYLTGIAASIEVAMILTLNSFFSVPLILCTFLAVLIMFMVFEYSHLLVPPIGAILILPLLLNKSDLLLYPVEVVAGCAIFISAAMFIFRNKAVSVPIEKH